MGSILTNFLAPVDLQCSPEIMFPYLEEVFLTISLPQRAAHAPLAMENWGPTLCFPGIQEYISAEMAAAIFCEARKVPKGFLGVREP